MEPVLAPKHPTFTVVDDAVSIPQFVYDTTKTGLLLKEETTTTQGDTEIPTSVEYKNYKKFGSLMFPTEVTRTAGGQEIPLKYSDIKINEGVTEADFK